MYGSSGQYASYWNAFWFWFSYRPIGIFPKWNGNSKNLGNLTNHWRMNWSQFEDPVWYPCLAGAVAVLTNPFINFEYFLLLNSGKFREKSTVAVWIHVFRAWYTPPRLYRSHCCGKVMSSVVCVCHYPRCIRPQCTGPTAFPNSDIWWS